MKYHQLDDGERHVIGTLLRFRFSQAAIARVLGRSRSTILREIKRNAYPRRDGAYIAHHACSMARGRRRRARQGSQFTRADWQKVTRLIREDYSPEQASGHLRRTGELSISHETIYRYLWQDKANGGSLHRHLRGSRKQRRKRYGHHDSRGRLAGKRPLGDRPPGAENRTRVGHWEIDTVLGSGRACILTIVDRKTGYVLIGQLDDRTVKSTNARLRKLLDRETSLFRTITSDNGCEFHGYREVEQTHAVTFYFAAPHHSWERGTNENTNGLIRQYLPKGTSMDDLTQAQCNAIANKLNNRPRKRHGFKTPAELYRKSINVALHS